MIPGVKFANAQMNCQSEHLPVSLSASCTHPGEPKQQQFDAGEPLGEPLASG